MVEFTLIVLSATLDARYLTVFIRKMNLSGISLLVWVMNLERLLASSCRCKILRVLSSSGRTNIMQLVRRVNSTYNQVNSNLQILREEGIALNEHFGRMRVIRLNKKNPRTLLLLKALKILENSRDANRL